MASTNSQKKTYSPYSREAVLLLGKMIKQARIQKRWSEKELAERANVSRETVQRAEKGAPACAVGTVFELAFLVDIRLFESELSSMKAQSRAVDANLVLLPSRIRQSASLKVADDDF